MSTSTDLLDWQPLYDRGIAALHLLRSRGHVIDCPCRFDNHLKIARSIMDRKTEQIAPTHEGAEHIFEACAELTDLSDIVETLFRSQPPRRVIEATREMMTGPDLSLSDMGRKKGRSTQHELAVAAILTRAGLKPELAEPDITVTFEHRQIGLAAKKLRSVGGLEGAVDDAGRQIRDAGVAGVIALDLSIPAMGHPPRGGFSSLQDFQRIAEQYVKALRDTHMPEILKWTSGRPAIGVWFRTRLFAHIVGQGVATYVLDVSEPLHEPDPWFEGLFDRLIDRISPYASGNRTQ